MHGAAVPLIDLSAGRDPQDIAKEVGMALNDRSLGFFQVKNYGIDPELEAEVDRLSSVFFKLGVETKKEIERTQDNSRGYVPFKSELTKQRVDWKEAFDWGHATPGGEGVDGDNRWMDEQKYPELKGFRETFERYQQEYRALGERILEFIAMSLGKQKTWFKDMQLLDPPFDLIRVNHYPACDEELSQHKGVHHHTDASLITMLRQDMVGGLQVKDNVTRYALGEEREGDDDGWINVEPVPGAIVINTGDMVQVLSNDRYKANLHRVLTNGKRERFSLPYFLHPQYHAQMTPIEEPAVYQTFKYGDFLTKRSEGNMGNYGTEVQISQYHV